MKSVDISSQFTYEKAISELPTNKGLQVEMKEHCLDYKSSTQIFVPVDSKG